MTDRCPTCAELVFEWQAPHVCKPKWWCWFDDGDDGHYETDNGTAVYADDACEAAAHFCATNAEDTTSWNETIVVKSVLTGDWFKVDVAASVEWYASSYNNPTPFAPGPCRDESAPPKSLERKVHPDNMEEASWQKHNTLQSHSLIAPGLS